VLIGRDGIEEEQVRRVVLHQSLQITGTEGVAPVLDQVSNLVLVVGFRSCLGSHDDLSLEGVDRGVSWLADLWVATDPR
jgi:hypothetical protein